MDTKKDCTLTGHIKLVARGISDNGQRFCKLRVNGDLGVRTIVVRETRLEDHRDQLEAIGANLVSRRAFTELENRIQANGSTRPTFHVVTRIEIRDDAMALPGGAYPETDKFEVALTDVPAEIQRKYMTRGTLKKWQDLARLARGNSRMNQAAESGALHSLLAFSRLLPSENGFARSITFGLSQDADTSGAGYPPAFTTNARQVTAIGLPPSPPLRNSSCQKIFVKKTRSPKKSRFYVLTAII